LKTQDKPNIIFILTDDQAIWAAGCYGNSEIRTPNIDALASTGVRIENFFCASPVCSPSRATYLTGKINSQHGVHDWIRQDSSGLMPETLLDGEVTYVDTLAAHGWECSLSGKWHLGERELGEHGFSRYYMRQHGGGAYVNPAMSRDGVLEHPEGYVTDLITDDALAFIDDCSTRDQRFYASVHYTAPHSPWYGHPQDIVDSYDDCNFDSCPQEDPHPWMTGSPTEFKGGKEMLKGYFAAVTAMDANVGRIVQRLDDLGIRDDTLIIFTSDNGFNFGHHGIWGKGNGTYPFNMYEYSVRLPCVLNQPGTIIEGQVLEGLYSSYDMFPTLLGYVDLPVPPGANLPGKDFSKSLVGPEIDASKAVVVFDEFGGTRMVRTKEWKYVQRLEGEPNELWDMVNDPDERNNLIDDSIHTSQIASLKTVMENWFDNYAEPHKDGRYLGITGFGQLGRLDANLEENRKHFAKSWSDPKASDMNRIPPISPDQTKIKP